jgi:hypothetical protein
LSDYESSYMMGLISGAIIFVLMCFVFWATSPVWFGFVSALAAAMIGSGLSASYPQVAAVINNLTFSISVVFFALIATPLVYIIVLPFLREVQQT